MEFKEFKKFNYINGSKKFCNHFHYICLYYKHTHYGISQRKHVFRVYVIHSNCARLHNFFSLWWTMVKMAIYTQKCEQKWLKINNRGGWNKDVLGGKVLKINYYSGLESISFALFFWTYLILTFVSCSPYFQNGNLISISLDRVRYH